MRWDEIVVPAVILAIVGAYVFVGSVWAQDDSPPATIIECRQSGAIGPPYTAWAQQTLGPVDLQVNPDQAAFTWCRYISGDQACIHTGQDQGGRECNDGHRNCGFFMRGWEVFGRSGASCTGFGIPECNGWCF